ncbi:metallo-beta-lactamase domain-containing protein 1 [Tachyglossus aculeatus]|uniref:metallo-beta-lactamase domain-containing protein 1 n=1 Tax=Tachyglossus aculeatus TaxID=9261 RepID=UPI0018F654B8|nr:metallo-beta-lactamase domain-containing protein 1 [Tachyglossus aculeatus]
MTCPVRMEPLPGTPPLLIPGDPYSVCVLLRGYAEPVGDRGAVRADGSVTLIVPTPGPGPRKPAAPVPGSPRGAEAQAALERAAAGPILVDTAGPWARGALLEALAGQGLAPGDVGLVVATHGHSDHVGNLGLFPAACLLVSRDLCLPGGTYLPHGLAEGRPLRLGPGLEVWATPGHGGAGDVSVAVAGTARGTVLVAGDVFEREGDGDGWRELSEDPAAQERSRRRVLAAADVVVPGHGGPFRVVRGAPGPQETHPLVGSGQELDGDRLPDVGRGGRPGDGRGAGWARGGPGGCHQPVRDGSTCKDVEIIIVFVTGLGLFATPASSWHLRSLSAPRTPHP